MVAVMAGRVGRLGRPARARRVVLPAVAGGAGLVVRALLAGVLAVRGLAGLLLISYGAWLAHPAAGFITAGVLVLGDRLLDDRPEREVPRADG